MDDTDRQLLIHLQREIPFLRRPFEAIGKKIGLDSADVILRIQRLQEEKVIRQISAIFDMDQTGYQSVLVAMKVVQETMERTASIISRHPGVPCCSKWRGEYNLWFLLALPPVESVEDHCKQLQQLTGATKWLVFRSLKIYKPAESRRSGRRDLTEAEIQLARVLQEDFPLTDEPFLRLAKQAGLSDEQTLLRQILVLQKDGFLKRVAAVSAFREKAAENALVMWRIPEEKMEAVGVGIASFPEVQSCLQRTTPAELPYPLHAMMEEVSEDLLKRIEEKIGLWPSQCFLKVKDYKKTRLKYFPKDLEEWRSKTTREVLNESA